MKRNYLLLSLHIFLLGLGQLPLSAQIQDFTAKVKNTASAWGGTGTYQAGDITCAEYYASGHFYHGTFSQTVTGLPVGVYEAEVYFNASCAAWECAEICADGTTGRTHFYMNDAEVDVPVRNTTTLTEPTLYTVKGIHVSDGTLRLGARNDREGANWHLVRLKSLKYMGTDARSLYDALFPLIRQAREVQAASTCPDYGLLLRKAIGDCLAATPSLPASRLRTLYDNLEAAIEESLAFEVRKATSLKNLLTRLKTFQRDWNNGTKPVGEEQWALLIPAVERASVAKDSECDTEAMDAARTALVQAMTEATAIRTPQAAPSSSATPFTIDGRRATDGHKGLTVQDGQKILQ